MKKKYVIILLVILLLVACLIFVSVKVIEAQSKNEELELIKIFEEKVSFQAFVENSTDNINDIQKKLENIEYVKKVKFISKEDALEEMKNKIDVNYIDEYFSDNNNTFSNSFIITLDIKNIEDLKEVKTLEDNIRKIDGIKNVNSSCNEFIEVYEKTGIKGIREYDKILTIMNEQGLDGINAYLEDHEETRELLKDFIHF